MKYTLICTLFFLASCTKITPDLHGPSVSLDAVAGSQIYFSSSGNDSNAGTSPLSPKKTIPKLQPGVTYLLNRGDTFYTPVRRISNAATIRFGAYGTGKKPVLSLYARIKPTAWQSDVANVWKIDFTNLANLTGATGGGITPNIGFLKINGWTIRGAKKKTKTALTTQWDFFSDATYLYVYSVGRPSDLASPIEASTDNNAISISDNMIVEDIKIIGSGQHAIGTNNQKNIIIRRVDVSEIGGCYLGGYGSGTTRYGNGIQLFNGGTNNLIENCSVSQVYDVALTMQTANTSLAVFQDCIFRNNITEKNDQDFENTLSATAGEQGFVRCRVTGNDFRNAGYGWSYALRPHKRGVSLLSYQWNTTKNDLIFENNKHYNPRNGLYYGSYDPGPTPLPPYTSRNNTIWIRATTKIRMKEDSYSTIYPWTIGTAADFVMKNNKEQGSVWYAL